MFGIISSGKMKREVHFYNHEVLIILLTVTMRNPNEQIITVFDANCNKVIYE